MAPPEHPVADLVTWLRWLSGFGAVVVAPGLLMRGFWIGGPWYERFAAGAAYGVALVSILSLVLAWTGPALTPFTSLTFCMAVAFLLARFVRERSPLSATQPGRREALIVSAMTLVFAGLLLFSLRQFVVPGHLHDAGNHAYMTWRISEAQSVASRVVWSGAYGSVEAPYPLGLHAVAAVIGRLSAVAPYVSTWYLSLALLIISPVLWCRLWRDQGYSPLAAALGAVGLLMCNAFPLGVVGWGGFTTIAGFALVPVAVRELLLLLRGQRVSRAIIAALVFGGLCWVHPLSAFMGMLLTVVGAAGTRRAAWSPWPWLVLAGLFAATVLPELVGMSGGFREHRLGPIREPITPVAGGFVSYLRSVVGEEAFIPLMLAVLVAGWTIVRRRVVVVGSLVVGALAIWVGASHDPVARVLGAPFYYSPQRIHYFQVMLLAPLFAAALLAAWRSRRRSLRIAGGVGAPLVLAAAVIGALDARENIESARAVAPVTVEDHRLAQRIAGVVGNEDWIANVRDDGTSWFLHLAGLSVVQPTNSWTFVSAAGRRRMAAVRRLADDLPGGLAALVGADVRYILLSEQGLPGWSPPVLSARIRGRPEVEVVDESPTTTLFRIVGEAMRRHPGQAYRTGFTKGCLAAATRLADHVAEGASTFADRRRPCAPAIPIAARPAAPGPTTSPRRRRSPAASSSCDARAGPTPTTANGPWPSTD